MRVSPPVPDVPLPSPDAAALSEPPPPDSNSYVELVWSFALNASGRLAEQPSRRLASLPAPVLALAEDAWVRRYLECAARSLAGRAPGGGSRTAWLSAQRRSRADDALPAGRAELLERLDGFTWTPDADRWRTAYNRVADFASTRGRIPARGDDRRLATWLANQRLILRMGRMDERRAAALAELPGWTQSLRTVRTRQVWESYLSRLKDFLTEGDGCYPDPHSNDADEAELGWWVNRQRDCHRRRDLSAQRVAALEALPKWRWSERDAVFDWRICELRRELDGAPLTSSHRLYDWVLSQRRRHRDGRLSDEQVADLTGLGLLP